MTLSKYDRGIAVLLLLFSSNALADGVVVGKIYHPYVEQLERELEWQATFEDGIDPQAGHRQVHKLGYGMALSEYWVGEVSLVGEKTPSQGFDIIGMELEARWQLSEQGEYAVDWGLLFEVEREFQEDIWEVATVLLVEKEWGRWSSTANLAVIYEWGDDIKNEFETGLAFQHRYRYSPYFEPAIEFFSGEDGQSLGAAILGSVPLLQRGLIHWELGVGFGVGGDSTDRVARAVLEYEF